MYKLLKIKGLILIIVIKSTFLFSQQPFTHEITLFSNLLNNKNSNEILKNILPAPQSFCYNSFNGNLYIIHHNYILKCSKINNNLFEIGKYIDGYDGKAMIFIECSHDTMKLFFYIPERNMLYLLYEYQNTIKLKNKVKLKSNIDNGYLLIDNSKQYLIETNPYNEHFLNLSIHQLSENSIASEYKIIDSANILCLLKPHFILDVYKENILFYDHFNSKICKFITEKNCKKEVMSLILKKFNNKDLIKINDKEDFNEKINYIKLSLAKDKNKVFFLKYVNDTVILLRYSLPYSNSFIMNDMILDIKNTKIIYEFKNEMQSENIKYFDNNSFWFYYMFGTKLEIDKKEGTINYLMFVNKDIRDILIRKEGLNNYELINLFKLGKKELFPLLIRFKLI